MGRTIPTNIDANLSITGVAFGQVVLVPRGAGRILHITGRLSLADLATAAQWWLVDFNEDDVPTYTSAPADEDIRFRSTVLALTASATVANLLENIALPTTYKDGLVLVIDVSASGGGASVFVNNVQVEALV